MFKINFFWNVTQCHWVSGSRRFERSSRDNTTLTSSATSLSAPRISQSMLQPVSDGMYKWKGVGRDSTVGIATRYGLDGPGIESRRGEIFRTHPENPGAHPASCTMGTGSFSEAKRPGRGTDHPLPSSAEVQERAELYLYSTSGPSWPVLGWTLPCCFVSLH